MVERMQLLLRSSTMSNASLDAIAEFASGMQEARFEPGDSLWRSGEPSGYSLFLLSGTVRCDFPDAEGWFRCGPVYPLGNLESLCGCPRWFNAVAETRLYSLRADTEALLDILEDHFGMAMDLLAANSNNLLGLLEAERRG